MRCASYTRKMSNDPRACENAGSIGEQNARIEAYIKARGWTLRQKYSDRKSSKDDNQAFLQMKADACSRSFDCLVFDSVYRLGGDTFKSIHYLRENLYPCGIHFAVIEDDFCSADHTTDEVNEYLEQKRLSYFGLYAKERMRDSSMVRKYVSYTAARLRPCLPRQVMFARLQDCKYAKSAASRLRNTAAGVNAGC